MPQHQLPYSDASPTVVGLVVTVLDQTLLSMSDATEVAFYEEVIDGSRYYVGGTTLVGVQQDYLTTLIERALVAHRYGASADVRKAIAEVRGQAREHAKAHEKR